ncbi:HNH endonuclease signature motif containing protein [Streptomyces sp. NPDC056227]|uniref:HNH endonuclease signature motif containing protein n=1 Tax=Streptomyces sp. NPDC056227 TaxID=3345753 RepID=UPI0035E27A47
MTEALPTRFLSKTRQAPSPRPDLEPCWLWTAAVSSTGYGMTWNGHTVVGAHVFAYQQIVGPIPAGLHLDHLCRVPLCVNPQHLEPVTPGENVRRGNSPGAVAVRTGMCQRGHALAGTNVTHLSNGHRRCKACHRARQARYDAARRGR